MKFIGGTLVGLAIAILLGAALADGKKDVNYTAIAGVGGMLTMVGAITLQRASRRDKGST